MPIDLRAALACHQRGELAEASRIYEAAIAADPNGDVAYHLLGMLELNRGNLTRAIDLMSRSISLRPGVPEYHGGIAEAYWSIGQVDRAVQSAQEALRLDPSNWIVRCNLGTYHVRLGQIDAAATLFREAIQLRPDFAQGHNNLGHALQLQGKSAAALDAFRAAVRLDPTSAEARANLGKTLLARGEYAGALEHCQEAIRLQPDSPDAHVKLGNVYQVLDRLPEAEACFRRAIELRPHHPGAYASLGGVLEHLGHAEQSIAAFRDALRLDPHLAPVLARLATRLKDRLPEPDLAAIEGLLASPGLIPEQRATLQFGLAQVCDGRGDFDRAATLANEANARQNAEFIERGLKYDPVARAADVEQLIDAFSPEFIERVRGWGLPTERPVFIVGMPRSGTSLVEQIVASHSKVFGAGELRLAIQTFTNFTRAAGPVRSLRECVDRLDRSTVESLASHHLDALDRLNRSADRIVDKMPENTFFLGLIAALFPRARVIYCRRDPRDTALSCWMTQFGQVRWSCDADLIAARIAETRRLMDHWRKVLPIPIVEVVYEELVDDLEAGARNLVAACGLDWEPACLDFHQSRREVRTASVMQVRQPIYRGSVGRWKNYERSLAFLFEKLEN